MQSVGVDVLHRDKQGPFQGGFNVSVAGEFVHCNAMNTFNGSNLGAGGSVRENRDGARVDWTHVGVSRCNDGVGNIREDEPKITEVSTTQIGLDVGGIALELTA
jgi:hypothetical protein